MNGNRTQTIVLTVLAVLLIGLLAVSVWLLLRDELLAGNGGETVAAQSTTAPATTQPDATSTTEVEATETVAEAAELPPVVMQVITATPTDTPIPATDTPTATATPLPTETPLPPTATNTPRPVVVPPTSTPVPPTATSPPPVDTRGLSVTHFALQPRSTYGVNGRIWFEFNLVNSSGGDVPYARLGVLPRKDGADRYDYFQQSWGGLDHVISPAGLNWEDNIQLPEAGSYTLRMAICFGAYDACLQGGGTWVTLSQEIGVSIN